MATSRTLDLAAAIDRFTAAVGRASAWLCLLIVVLQFALVVARYLFGVGSIWLTETVLYAHGALFLLVAAWTLQVGGHVRVDVFYAGLEARTRGKVDLAGAVLLLLPFMAVLAWFGWSFAMRSWIILERSQEASGLPFVYLFKSLIVLFAGLLALQGLSQALRAAAELRRKPRTRHAR